MNRNHLATLLAAILIVSGMLALHKNEEEIQAVPQTVPYVNITRYAGTWWEQAYIPYFWERGCANTHAIYSLKDNGQIKVDNHCDKNGQDSHNVGKAIPEDSTNAKLKVEFVQTLDVGGQYWITKLGDEADYGYVVVSSPNYNYLWIMSRQKKMDEKLYDQIIDWMKAKGGYRIDKLVKTTRT